MEQAFFIFVNDTTFSITNVENLRAEFELSTNMDSTNVSSFTSVLEKLTEQNLGDKDPHPFVEWFFYSHPSIKKRISAIQKFVREKGLA